MAEQPSKSMTNQEKQDFPVDAILVGGDSMDGGKSLQQQIRDAPESVLWKPLIDWGKYKTSVLGQLAYNAQAHARQEALLVALMAAVAQLGKGEAIDYDRINQMIEDNLQEFTVPEFTIPEFEIIVKPKEG
jgi:hypothetical protein